MSQKGEEDVESHNQYVEEDDVADVDPEYCKIKELTVRATKEGCSKTNVCH